jgi:flagellar FliJ protein
MADLNPLIRVRKHTVEQKQKFLAELYRQSEILAAQKQELQEQMAQEREKLKQSNSVDMMRYFNVYNQAVNAKIKDIEQSMKMLDTRIEIAREDMREAFADLKKISITQERRETEEIAELNKKESQLLDEMAIDGYRRRVAEE